ncbi:MAG: branched-chain amino acid ABC transporter permease [Dongiaceae bacterium]
MRPAAAPAPGRPWQRLAAQPMILFVALFAAFPLVAPYDALATQVLIFGLFALSFNLLYSHVGLFSLGQAAFYGLGAYGTGLALPSAYGLGAAIARFKVDSLWVGLAAGIAAAGIGALLIGALCLRRRGIYFSMLTLAFAQVLYFTALQASPLTGGHSGLRGIPAYSLSLGGLELPLDRPVAFYYFTLALVALAVVAMRRLLGSPFGAVLRAIHDNEARAAACGHDVRRLKLLAFVWAGLFAGLAGSLSALHLRLVSINVFDWPTSAEVVVMTLLGGAGSFFGPFVGAAAYLVLQEEVSRATEYWSIVIGFIVVLCVRFFPAGICGWLLPRLAAAGRRLAARRPRGGTILEGVER